MGRVNRWFVVPMVMTGIFMSLLDVTAVNVAIPKMMPELNADIYDIQWVVIAYIISSAIAMLSTGYLGNKFGRKNIYSLGLGSFVFGSALCGFSKSLPEMIIFRSVQGMGEGFMIPLGLPILYEYFPLEERGKASGLYAIGATFGPAIGPSLGGYIVEYLNWRYIFYINVPFGVLDFFLIQLFLETQPPIEREKFDFLGFSFISLSLTSLLIGLSKGHEWGWFEFKTVFFLVSSLILFFLFLIQSWFSKNPIVDFSIFKRRNYILTFVSVYTFGFPLLGVIFLVPIYLEKVRGIPTLITGLIMFPGAVATGVCALLSGYLSDRWDPKRIFLFGVASFFFTTYLLSHVDLYTKKTTIAYYLILRGASLGFIFPPALAMALFVLPNEKMNAGSSLLNIIRLVGGSFGTAFSATNFDTRVSVNFEGLVSKLTYSHKMFVVALKKSETLISYRSVSHLFAEKRAFAFFKMHIMQKASTFAFQDVIIMISFFLIVSFLLGLIMEEKKEVLKRTPTW